MEVTKEMLDVIEEVKGKRQANLWDPRCAQAFAAKNKKPVESPKPAVKVADKS